MKNTNIRLNELFRKYLENDISEIELSEFSDYLEDPAFIDEIKSLLGIAFKENSEVLSIGANGRVRVIQNILGTEVVEVMERRVSLWPRIAVAAAVTTIIFGAGLFYYHLNSNQQQPNQTSYKNDVAPGKTGATLTLANGKKISLTDAANGELAKEAGVSISKSADGKLVYEITGNANEQNKINTLSTAKGETYEVRLPDGSLVALNAASSLEYPANFTALKQRRVKLTGEGYFEIAKDKLHPFIVETNKQEVEVLGTHFNINAYQDEPAIATTLIEGSVKVSSNKTTQIIKPGEQAVTTGSSIAIVEADVETVKDWKDGDFVLKDMNFRTAMRKIARWYDLEVIYDPSVPEELESGGWISRNTKLSEVLAMIEKSGLVQFKVEGKKLYVSRVIKPK